jgi:hypothetical protein
MLRPKCMYYTSVKVHIYHSRGISLFIILGHKCV